MAMKPENDPRQTITYVEGNFRSATNLGYFTEKPEPKPASHWPQFRKLNRHERRKRAAELRKGK